jgi:O-antigen/teichoic acid export membrane protein
MWMTISSVIALLGFADLGMGNGLLNAIAEANGKDDTQSAKMYISSAFFLLLGIALSILLGFVVLYSTIPWARVFNVSSSLAVKEAGPATAILIVSFALNMPLGIVQRIQMGYQEGYRAQIWMIVGTLLGLVGVLVAIYINAGLPWLVLGMSGGPMLSTILNWAEYFGGSRRWLLPSRKMFNWMASRRVAGIGFLFVILQLFMLLGNTSDNIVIAQVLGASAVAGYAVTQKLFSITQISQYFLIPLWPAFGESVARNDLVWARRTLNHAIALSLGLGILISLPLLIFGKQIVAIWVGPGLVPSFFLLLGFTLSILVNSYVTAISTFLNSGNLVGRQISFYGLASISALFLKVLGAKYWNVEGVALAAFIGYGLFYIFPATKLAYRSLRV